MKSSHPSISLGGTVIEVGKNAAGAHEVVLEVTSGQLVTVTGVSETFTRFLGGYLYKDVMLSIEVLSP